MRTARNVAIILGLAALVSLAPGGGVGYATVSNIISIVFLAGMAFFSYRMYMENRVALFDLPDRQRVMLYGSAALLVFALVATKKFFDDIGAQSATILLWFAMIGAAVYGFVTVFRAWREY